MIFFWENVSISKGVAALGRHIFFIIVCRLQENLTKLNSWQFQDVCSEHCTQVCVQ